MTTATKTWTKEEIKALLTNSDQAVIRGLLAVYEKQTNDEKNAGNTKYHNGVGFSAYDAEFMTSLAQKAEKGWKFTDKQMYYARKKIMRYAGQLAKIANGEV